MNPVNPVAIIREDDLVPLLDRWRNGDPQALPALAGLAYGDLREIAGKLLLGERPGHTLQATGLVNELYLRLAQVRLACFSSPQLFLSFAARTMRMILVDHARQARALKRPGSRLRVPLHENMAWVDAAGDQMLELEQALLELERHDSRKARAIELRYFLGCSHNEVAEALGVSRMTVHRELEYSKAWLYRRLNPEGHSAEHFETGGT
jgi:RNA polymerase sigma factor (TIGR02999 family)